MTSPVLMEAPRNVRRVMLRNEDRRRSSGDWGPWVHLPLPNGAPGTGWCRQVVAAHKNEVFAVLERPTPTARHLAVSSLSGVRPTWWEMQRIKDDLAGADATAVEVYPPHGEIVDGADMFHIWVLPNKLPFSLWEVGQP